MSFHQHSSSLLLVMVPSPLASMSPFPVPRVWPCDVFGSFDINTTCILQVSQSAHDRYTQLTVEAQDFPGLLRVLAWVMNGLEYRVQVSDCGSRQTAFTSATCNCSCLNLAVTTAEPAHACRTPFSQRPRRVAQRTSSGFQTSSAIK